MCINLSKGKSEISAVHTQHLAGDEGCAVPKQERAGACHILGRAQAAKGRFFRELGFGLLAVLESDPTQFAC